jgi:cell division septal protein FtsQ
MKSNVVDLRGGPRRPDRGRGSRSEPPRRERRPLSLRARRRRIRIAVAIGVVLLLGAAVYAVHAASYAPRLTISSIDVTGTETVDPEAVRSYIETKIRDGQSHFFSRSNIFLYPRAEIERGLVAEFPRIKSVSASRAGVSQTLTVAIEERAPFARWCDPAGTCYAMDEDGFIFAQEAASSTTAFAQPYRFAGGLDGAPVGQTFIPGHVPGVVALLRILQQQGGVTPTDVDITNDQDIAVHFSEGFYLKASFGEDAGDLARNLALVLSSSALQGKRDELEYVDLRFGNRVYYKLKGADQEQQ